MATYLQSARPLVLATTLGADKLLCLAVTGTDALSQCYRLQLELASEDAAVSGADLLRTRVTLQLQLADGNMRKLHGMVRRFAQTGQDTRFTYYNAEVVPEFWFLSLRRDCRVFQHKSALDIVEQILGSYSIEYRTLGSVSPPQREYCVQYRETDLDFVSRLLEEEGLYYTFDHTSTKEKLVIAGPTGTPPDLGAFRPRRAPMLDEDIIHAVSSEVAVHTSKVTLTDYNMETPTSSLLRSVDSTTAGAGEEVYDYPGGYATGDDGLAIGRRLVEAEETDEQVIRGTSECRPFESGSSFTLAEHFNSALNASYLLISVSFRAQQAAAFVSGAGGFRFDNEFVAIPATRKYVPRRLHPRPVVRGTQTALVVGTSGEEIDTDKYGRVKVQFYWDRVGTTDQNSSCWVRVASTWAGKNWGAIHIPRLGQEVIVDFLEGDPDHPIIVGSVYNFDQMPPYELPANKTQSGIKSRSSLGGGPDNFNEIRFEDKQGSEELHVQAEKDMTLLVKNDETRDVQHDRTTTIKNNDTRTVSEGDDTHTVKKGNQTVTVEKGDQVIEVKEGDRLVTVGQGDHVVEVKQGDQTFIVSQGKQTTNVKMGDHVVTVGQGNQTIDVKMGNQTTKVDMGNQEVTVSMGNRSIKVNLGSISEEALQGIELKVGGNSIKIDQMGVTIQGLMVKVEGQVQTQVKGLMTQVGGDAMLQLQGGITMIG